MVGRPKRAAAKAVTSYAADTNGIDDDNSPPAKGASKGKASKAAKKRRGRGNHSDDSDADEYRAPEGSDEEEDDEDFEAAERTDDDDGDAQVEEPEGDLIDDNDGGRHAGKKARGKFGGGDVAKPQQRGTLPRVIRTAFPSAWASSTFGPTVNDVGYFGSMQETLSTSVFPNVNCMPSDFIVHKSSDHLTKKLSLSSEPYSFMVEADKIELDGYHAHRIRKDGSQPTSAFIANTGLSILAMDWAPLPDDSDVFTRSTESTMDYVAVGGTPLSLGGVGSTEPPVLSATESYPNVIQIWGINCQSDDNNTDDDMQSANQSLVRLEMVILQSYGAVLDLKWCSIGGHLEAGAGRSTLDRLGILAASFGDGTIRFFIVPTPFSLRKHLGQKKGNRQPLYVEFDRPFATFKLDGALALSIAWGTEKRFAAGGSDGRIYVWDTESLFGSYSRDMNDDDPDLLLPYFVVDVHTQGVRCIDWARTSDGQVPYHIISAGMEGKFKYTDIRDVGFVSVLRSYQYIPYALAFVPWLNAYIYAEPDKAGRFEMITANLPAPNIRFLAPPGNIWSMTYSDFHPYIAAGSDGGATYYANATYNAPRTFITPQTRVFGGRIIVESTEEDGDNAGRESDLVEQTRRAFESMEQEAAELDTVEFAVGEGDAGEDLSESAIRRRNGKIYAMQGKDTMTIKHAEAVLPDIFLFPPSICVRRVQWSRNYHSATWLASGIANGLLRIDNCRAAATRQKPSTSRDKVTGAPKKLGRPRKDPSITQAEKARREKEAAFAAKVAKEAERKERMERARAAREASASQESNAQPRPPIKLAPIFAIGQRWSARRGSNAGVVSDPAEGSSSTAEPLVEADESVAEIAQSSDDSTSRPENETATGTQAPVDTSRRCSIEVVIPVNPRRGRPPKTTTTASAPPPKDSSSSASPQTIVDTPAPAAPPKRRGRPPKTKVAEQSKQGTSSVDEAPASASGPSQQQTLLSMQGVLSSLPRSSVTPTSSLSPAGSRDASPAPGAAVPASPRKTKSKKIKEEPGKPNRSLKDMWGVKPSK
ncbi:hypothetical protein BGW42_000656 [Actinomortierella wolfii]|nr:hypothetical protein BGW42_000656 [Actinomortierella wolfii]